MTRAFLAHSTAALLLGVIAFATYSNSFDGDFTLDSRAIILNAPRVHAATLENVSQIFSLDYWAPTWVSGAYRPLTTLSYLVNYAIMGNAAHPLGYHAVNLALHWMNALLVYLVVRSISAGFAPALLAAALFITHPVTTDAVTNIVGRADLLAAASVMLGLLLYSGSQRTSGWLKLVVLTALVLVLTAGLFCKESALVIVGVLILFDVTFRLGTVTSLASLARQVATFATRGWLILALPLGLFWGVRRWVYSTVAPAPVYFTDNPLIAADFWAARLTAVKVLGRYVALLFWPERLCCDYSVNQVPLFGWRLNNWEDLQALLALAGCGLIAMSAIYLFRRSPPLFFSIGFIFVTLLPTTNLLILIPAVMAERFLYLPSVGFAGTVVLAAVTVARAVSAERGSQVVVYALLALVVAAYGIRAHRRNADWTDNLTLFTRAVQSCPGSFRVHQGLAASLYGANPKQNVDRAIAEAETAQAILERSAPGSIAVPGFVLEDLGGYYLAKASSSAAERGTAEAGAAPARAWARKAAEALERAAAWQRAANDEHRAIELQRGRPADEILDFGNSRLHLNLGVAYAKLGDSDRALQALLQARHLDPANADVYLKLSASHELAGDIQQAILDVLQAAIVDRSRQDLWPRLFALYQKVDPGNCAFTFADNQYHFNDNCPAVRQHLCGAFGQLADTVAAAHRLDEAQQLRRNAELSYGCARPENS